MVRWGVGGNYASGEEFVQELMTFWCALYTYTAEGALCGDEKIIVFEEPEQEGRATAFEIFYDPDSNKVSYTRHECPFSWSI